MQQIRRVKGSRAMSSLEEQAYKLGQGGYRSQRPADSPEDINGVLRMGAPVDQVESLYYDHYVRGYNDAYRESLKWTAGDLPDD